MASMRWSFLLLLAACAADNEPPQHPHPLREAEFRPALAELTPALAAAPAAEPEPALDRRFTSMLLQTAGTYASWGRVDAEPNLAPVLCRAPYPRDYGKPSQVRLSEAQGSPHDRKLYYLWASDRDIYLGSGDIPVGFTIVKEAWTAKPATEPEHNPFDDRLTVFSVQREWPPIRTLTTADGERLTVDQPSSLYVMTKVGPPGTPGTDRGWVYGTLTPDGSIVTSAGRVQQCMSCHESATRERLFGLR